MSLTVKTAGAAELGDYMKTLVVGPPGSGKTRFSSTWPNALIASCEGGMMSVKDRGTKFVEIGSSRDMTEVRQLLIQSPDVRAKQFGKLLGADGPTPIDTIVVDTLDEYARILEIERLKQTGKDAFAIQDWGWLGNELRAFVRDFRNMDINVVFTCHIKSMTDEDTGSVFMLPGIKGGFANEVAGYFDIVGLLTSTPHERPDPKTGDKIRTLVRVLQTFPDKRHDWLKDRSGCLPMEFPISLNDDYERMSTLIFGDVKTREAAITEDLKDLADSLAGSDKVDAPVDEGTTVGEGLDEAVEVHTDTDVCAGGKTVAGTRDINKLELAEMKYGVKLCAPCAGCAKDGTPTECGVEYSAK